MSRATIFWFLMIIWFLFGILTIIMPWQYRFVASEALIFVLLALLGWQTFGAAIK